MKKRTIRSVFFGYYFRRTEISTSSSICWYYFWRSVVFFTPVCTWAVISLYMWQSFLFLHNLCTLLTINSYQNNNRKKNTDLPNMFPINTDPSEDAMRIIAAPTLGEGSRWSSSSLVIVDRPPSQPLRDTSDSRWSSVDQVAIDTAPSQPLRHTSDSRWGSVDQVAIDTAPSQPLHDTSDSRWSSVDRAVLDTAPSQPLARPRVILGPSLVSTINESLRHPTEMKNINIKRTTVKILSPYGRSPSSMVVSVSPRFRRCGAQLPSHALSAWCRGTLFFLDNNT